MVVFKFNKPVTYQGEPREAGFTVEMPKETADRREKAGLGSIVPVETEKPKKSRAKTPRRRKNQ